MEERREIQVFNNYAELLKPSLEARQYDKKIFEEWRAGKINTLECFQWFMKNNGHEPDLTKLDGESFVMWMHSLGY